MKLITKSIGNERGNVPRTYRHQFAPSHHLLGTEATEKENQDFFKIDWKPLLLSTSSCLLSHSHFFLKSLILTLLCKLLCICLPNDHFLLLCFNLWKIAPNYTSSFLLHALGSIHVQTSPVLMCKFKLLIFLPAYYDWILTSRPSIHFSVLSFTLSATQMP